MRRVLRPPDKFKLFREQVIHEIYNLGLGSMGIITIISVFIGAVITLQTAANLYSSFIPLYTVGFAARQSVILEFSPTIIALILAGKVGSNIASEIGTMRVTEQIDALEIMGVNSANFLILPKVVACVLINPFLILLSMFMALLSGWLVCEVSGIIPRYDFFYGLRFEFDPFSITYALIKTVFFALIIASVSAYQGYFVKGGALEVGRGSTKGVVYSSISILTVNYIITQLMLI